MEDKIKCYNQNADCSCHDIAVKIAHMTLSNSHSLARSLIPYSEFDAIPYPAVY